VPRKKRIWYPGATYHVMSRGNRRSEIFSDEYDHIVFLQIIKRIKEKYPFAIHSLCLMTNHFHIALETGDTELWKIMQKILACYAEEYNYRHHITGHLFEGRYTSCLIRDDTYFLEVSRYIHLNPVKAKIVRNPLEYAYSSYGAFVGRGTDKGRTPAGRMIRELVDTSRVLSYFEDDPHMHYRLFVEGGMSHTEHETLIQNDMGEDDMWL
jgi:REP element-mobilizing transposase RayT